jgi:hypothetical protein
MKMRINSIDAPIKSINIRIISIDDIFQPLKITVYVYSIIWIYV